MDCSGLSGLALERDVPEGWRVPAAAHQHIKAADMQLRRGPTLNQLQSSLHKFFDCLELDYDACEVHSL